MKLSIKIHNALDADAPHIGAFVFAKLVESMAHTPHLPEAPQPDLFMKMWASTNMMIFGAHDNGVILGVQAQLIAPSILSGAHLTATNVITWVDPKHRRMGVREALRQSAFAVLKSRGVKQAIVYVESGSPAHQATLKAGFEFPQIVGVRSI